MNADLLPPTNPTPATAKPQPQVKPNSAVSAASKPAPENENPKSTKPFPAQKLKNLPLSVYILITLVTITLILLLALFIVPKKGSKPADIIQTDSIPEPQISITNSEETKQTPFYDEIVDFRKKSNELDYNYPTYNLPVIETDINLAK